MRFNSMVFYTVGMALACMAAFPINAAARLSYPLVDTGQTRCFGERDQINCPAKGQPFYGQDGQYQGQTPAYADNGDGTVTDSITGLTWQQDAEQAYVTFPEAGPLCSELTLGGHDDWRVPSIKELLSIVDFSGNQHTNTPYLDTRYFVFKYPAELGKKDRDIDKQYWSSNAYTGQHISGMAAFGFNFADGRIKSYPATRMRRYVRCVRGEPYGVNGFVDNGDGSITDRATGLTWAKGDSGQAMTWEEALAYAASATIAGKSDWRLPNAKELQSIVDYSRSPTHAQASKRGPAIDPLFDITDEDAWFWTSTTHIETGGGYYVCFGKGTSANKQGGEKIDIHGAGALRSDPKAGSAARFSQGLGPQSDEVRIHNYARLVRGGHATPVAGENTKVQVGHSGARPRQDGPGRNGPPRRDETGERNMDAFGHGKQPRRGIRMGEYNDVIRIEQQGPPPRDGAQARDAARRQGPTDMGLPDDDRGRPNRGPGKGGFMRDHDANGDGRVTREEFRGPANHFQMFDETKEGVITEEEAPTGPPPR